MLVKNDILELAESTAENLPELNEVAEYLHELAELEVNGEFSEDLVFDKIQEDLNLTDGHPKYSQVTIQNAKMLLF